jgi:hypothetical protein
MARKTVEAEEMFTHTCQCFIMAKDDALRTGGGADTNPLVRMIQGHIQVTQGLGLLAGAVRDIYDKLVQIESRLPRH